MSLSVEKILVPAPQLPQPPSSEEIDSRLNISVVFTSVEATLAALKEAAALANRLAGRITLVVPQIVPYHVPLESPPVLRDWNERRFRVFASESPVETRVRLYLCRDRLDALKLALEPHSLVVIGSRKRWWWPTSEQALARTLRRAGHEVVLAGRE